jgi:hypothetical protein
MFLGRDDSKPQTLCKQGSDVSALLNEIGQELAADAARSPVAIDIVAAVSDLTTAPSWLAPLALRPGLDGACVGTRCLVPWQLLGRGTFATHAPIDFLPEIRFGISHKKLRKSLKAGAEDEAYQRIATHSFVLGIDGKVTQLRRLQVPTTRPDAESVAHAEQLFEQHILAAQLPSGQFRYTLDPFNGKADTQNFGLARQAGTAYALCDVGSAAPQVTAAANLALKFLAGYARSSEDGLRTGIALPTDRVVELGPSALSLIAFLRCRERLGPAYDAQIRGLSRFILSLQTPEGVFQRGSDRSLKAPKPGPMALYAQGQALLALVLLETALNYDPELLPGVPELAATIDRAMAYTTDRYWHHAMYPFFFLEENWHCLAARAALVQHRNPRYEQFCLDYVRFKSRLILDSDSAVDPELVGSFGLGNIIPPHSAGAAGFGEAVAAAVTLERARGESTARTTRVLTDIVGLVVRQQRTETNSFGCVPEALGGFPEQVHVPLTRIDFAQHAWSAVAHAKSELAW